MGIAQKAADNNQPQPVWQYWKKYDLRGERGRGIFMLLMSGEKEASGKGTRADLTARSPEADCFSGLLG
jgi:hypothetical protein